MRFVVFMTLAVLVLSMGGKQGGFSRRAYDPESKLDL